MTPQEREQKRQDRADLIERARKVSIVGYAARVCEWDKAKTRGRDYWANCPVHGEKTPSFHVHADGWFRCFGCGRKGDVITLCQEVEKISFDGAVEKLTGEDITKQVRQVQAPSRKVKERDPGKQRTAQHLWESAKDIRGTLAETYLRSRGIVGDLSHADIRFHPSVSTSAYSQDKGEKHPAMIAAIRLPTGEQIGAHVTYLSADGKSKAAVDPPRKVYGAQSGGVIFLGRVSAKMVLGEGIESSLSASEVCGRPAIASVCSGNMKSAPIIDGVDDWLVAYDRDANHTGLKAAQAFARRALDAAKAVRAMGPPRDVKDWNDAAQRRA